MSKARRFDYYPDDYITGVAGTLSATEQGVYWMVCSLIYSRGGPIPNDHVWLARMFADTHWRTVRAALDHLIELGKITLTEGSGGSHVTVRRCAEELQRAGKRISEASQNGRKGGRPRGSTDPENDVQDGLKSGSGWSQDGLRKPAGVVEDGRRTVAGQSQDVTGTNKNNEIAKAGGLSDEKLAASKQQAANKQAAAAAQHVEGQSGTPARPGTREAAPTAVPWNRASLDSLEAQLRAAASWEQNPSPALQNVSPIVRLLDAGASLELDVLPMVRARAKGCRSPNWGYFDKPIRQAFEERLAAPPLPSKTNGNGAAHAASPGALLADPGERERALATWWQYGEWAWAKWGVQPGNPGCAIPADEVAAWGPAHGWREPQVPAERGAA